MNFDESVDRRQYPTLKWSKTFLEEHFGNADVIPMSVADMDIKVPPSVIDKLQKRVAHGIFGYESKPESYYKALELWYLNRHKWKIEQHQIETCSSILSAIAILINQHSNEGDGVIVQSPFFFEFRMVIKNNKRTIVKNPLKLIDGKYHIDFNDLENKAADSRNKILILCNPHNPVGRVWSKDELSEVAGICERHNLFVITDEIHGDFAFKPHQYIPYLAISDTVSQNAAACISPAKTFNIAGMIDAITIIPNEIHRNRFHEFTDRYQTNKINVFANIAVETAYLEGADWLDKLLDYLQGNVAFIKEFLSENDINVSLIEPEGTFLVWLDFRALGFDVKILERFLADKAKIAVSPGYWFGREGAGFARMTVGCPLSTVKQALSNLSLAVGESMSL